MYIVGIHDSEILFSSKKFTSHHFETNYCQMNSRPRGHIFTSVSQKCRNSATLKPVSACRNSRSTCNSVKRRKGITYSNECIRFKKLVNWSALQYSLLFSTLRIVHKNFAVPLSFFYSVSSLPLLIKVSATLHLALQMTDFPRHWESLIQKCFSWHIWHKFSASGNVVKRSVDTFLWKYSSSNIHKLHWKIPLFVIHEMFAQCNVFLPISLTYLRCNGITSESKNKKVIKYCIFHTWTYPSVKRRRQCEPKIQMCFVGKSAPNTISYFVQEMWV